MSYDGISPPRTWPGEASELCVNLTRPRIILSPHRDIPQRNRQWARLGGSYHWTSVTNKPDIDVLTGFGVKLDFGKRVKCPGQVIDTPGRDNPVIGEDFNHVRTHQRQRL